MGETKRITWKAADGLDIEGLLTYPVGYESSKNYPLVLVIHGGPTGVFQDSFLGRYGAYPYATFAARGYAVLRANPRGSSGYGRTFRFANMNDWGGKDYLDLMAGVDHVISMGVADPDRLAVMGWSYGGFHDQLGGHSHAPFQGGRGRRGRYQLVELYGHLRHTRLSTRLLLGRSLEQLRRLLQPLAPGVRQRASPRRR